MDLMLEKVPNVVAMCVILYIICEMFGDHFQSQWELHEEQQQSETPTMRHQFKISLLHITSELHSSTRVKNLVFLILFNS